MSVITTDESFSGEPGFVVIDKDLLRELFAAFALAGIAAANLDQDYSVDAAMAYNYADAMLAQRAKGEKS